MQESFCIIYYWWHIISIIIISIIIIIIIINNLHGVQKQTGSLWVFSADENFKKFYVAGLETMHQM